nr:alpha/beta hydrolase [Nakamurella flavida]
MLPPVSFGPAVVRLLRHLPERPAPDPGPDVRAREITVPGYDGGPEVSLRLLRPAAASGPVPLLLWIHGGGLIIGRPEQDERSSLGFVRELGIAVASVRYRLAPEHPAPAAVDDVFAGLRGLLDRADELGIEASRVAVGGASAGGGLAAALAHRMHDTRRDGEPAVAFQLLVYPMLDDRTVTRPGHRVPHVRAWTPRSNRFGWTSYLGREPGSPEVPTYSVPARREDLTGLPPAWIGVGSLDLFHDEDVAYARRLRDADVPCALDVVPGAFHGFDALLPRAAVSRTFWRSQADALRGALLP